MLTANVVPKRSEESLLNAFVIISPYIFEIAENFP
jgi:hypothetical protein